MNRVTAAGKLSSKPMRWWSSVSWALALVLMGHASAQAQTAVPEKPEAAAPRAEEKARGAVSKSRIKPVQKPVQPSPPECQRIGQRVIAALARDDSGAALQFHTFYTAFACSTQELTQAFGCLVNLQTAVPSLSNPSPQQVADCWKDPTTLPEVAPPVSQKQGEGEGEKK